MSADRRPSSRDETLETALGASIAELHVQVTGPTASAGLYRVLELRNFLAIAEEQVARVRDRVHDATAAARDLGALSADSLRVDAAWLEAALAARDGYVAALDELLRTKPAAEQHPTRAEQVRPSQGTAPGPSAPAPARAGAVRARRP